MTDISLINCIINYKIKNNKNIIYKEDIIKIFSKLYELNTSQEEFMEKVMENINYYSLNIDDLTFENSFYRDYICFYYLSTFLDYEPVDIKIALKD